MEHLDHLLTDLAPGSAFPVVLLLALVLGLRHASDPDHLAAVAPLATGPGGRRRAGRVGAAWGAGHAATLLVVGVPLLLVRGEVPAGVGTVLERAVGLMIVVLALGVLRRWVLARRARRAGTPVRDPGARAPRTAFAVGAVHGLAGSGAVVLLLLAMLPSRTEAIAALLVFAPATALSMTVLTAGWTWLLARPALARLHRDAIVPGVSIAALLFGASYAGAF